MGNDFEVKGTMHFENSEQYFEYISNKSETRGILVDNDTKRIKNHLIFTPLDENEESDDNNSTAKVVAAVVVGGIAIVGGAIVGIVHFARRKKEKVFQEALNTYILKVKEGTADLETVAQFIMALNKITKKNGKLKIQLTCEQLFALVQSVYFCTIKIAQDHNIQLSELNEPRENVEFVFVDIRGYLGMQQDILNGKKI